jgi:hypothetical protein
MDYSIISTEELANLYFAASELDPDGESDAMRAMKAEYQKRGLTYQELLQIWETLNA